MLYEFSNLGVESFGFSTYSIMSYAKREFDFFFANLNSFFFSFCCLIADSRTSNTKLNSSGESGHPCRVPDLKGKDLSVSPLRISAVDIL